MINPDLNKTEILSINLRQRAYKIYAVKKQKSQAMPDFLNLLLLTKKLINYKFF